MTFTWSNGCHVADFWLSVGTTQGGTACFTSPRGTMLSGTVGGLPTIGQTLYVRLRSLISGAWKLNDYTSTAAGAVPQITSWTTMSAARAMLLAVTGSGFDPTTDTSARSSDGQGFAADVAAAGSGVDRLPILHAGDEAGSSAGWAGRALRAPPRGRR